VSVTTLEGSLPLALDNGPLLELVDDRPEVARGLIRFLARRIRQRAPAPAARSRRAGAELAASFDVDGAGSGGRRIGFPG
jgi:CRP-like cAMP-binding protein